LFAFAMTVLILDLKLPELSGMHMEAALWVALGSIAPRFTVCAMSFITLGIFWTGQQRQLAHNPVNPSNIGLPCWQPPQNQQLF
jgi:uncharacterized membrane protein